MSRIIIWEDLNIQTDIETGITEEIETEIDEESPDENFFNRMMPSEEIITSPFGMYHIRDYFNPMRQYNWHMAHTNFNVDQDVVDILCEIEGAEKLLLVSRYRFIIAFGRAFMPNFVKQNIYSALEACPPLSEDAIAKLKDLNDLYDQWALFFLDNDDWSCITDADKDYINKLNEFRDEQKKCGGIIITHENYETNI